MIRRERSAVFVGLAISLALTGCRSRDRSPETELRRAALDFDTGAVQGTVLWNGTPAAGLTAGFWTVSSDPPTWTATVDDTGHYSVPATPAGDFVANLTTRSACGLTGVIASRNVTVVAGETATADLDVTTSLGRVTGAIASNGGPVPNAKLIFARVSGAGGAGGTGAGGTGAGGTGGTAPDFPCAVGIGTTNASGQISNLVPPGSYTATVTGPVGSALGTLSFVVVAGQTTDAGVMNVPTGDVLGAVTWNDLPATATTVFPWFVSTPVGSSEGISSDGQFKITYVVPGDYEASVAVRFGCVTPPLATRSITVTAGATTTVDFDVTPTVGQVTGSISAAGVPLAAGLSFIRVDGAGGAGGIGGSTGAGGAGGIGGGAGSNCRASSTGTDASGLFMAFLPVGSYTATATAAGSSTTFPFAIAAGQTTDLGAIAFSTEPTGAVEGRVSWNGQPARGPFVGRGMIVNPWLPRVDDFGHYSAPVVLPGTYLASLRLAIACFPQPILATRDVTVVQGAVSTADFDITPAVGKVTGAITTNGVPLLAGRVSYVLSATGGRGGMSGSGGGGGAAGTGGRGGATCSPGLSTTSANGQFSALLPPGSYAATVASSRGGVIGNFAFPIVAGRTTDVDSVTTPACSPTSTPSCSEIPTDLAGGLGSVNGLELTFSDVDVGGNTTVVASGFGPAPPTGFQIMGSRYWNIDTTASHAGPIQVCIHYNPVEVMGSEDTLRLLHDDGGGWMTITTSLCKSDGCSANSDPCEPCSPNATVCGVATSLSPFAIAEPVDTTGPTFVDVPATIVAHATSTAGAIVSYAPPTAVDAVDGPRSVTCTPAPGSQFPPGRNTVTCTTSDTSGNPGTASFVVWVQYQASTDGSFFLKPIRADGSSVFKIGRPVPVKFRLTGASQNITDLRARLVVSKLSNEIRGTADDESDEDGDETDFFFKYRKGKNIYAYRWKTRDQTRGTFRLRADLGDDVVHEIDVSLKVNR